MATDYLNQVRQYLVKGRDYCILNPLLIKGEAGTGKTHLIRAIVDHYSQAGLKIFVTATTNPALDVARNRIPSLTANNSSTIHKRLGIKSLVTLAHAFSRTYEEIIPEFYNESYIFPKIDLLIVDEVSMLPEYMKNHIDNFSKRCGCVVIYVGDLYQLKPVNASNYYLNNIKDTIELTVIHRQKEGKLRDAVQYVRSLIHVVNNGKTSTHRKTVLNANKFNSEFCDGISVDINNYTTTSFINLVYKKYILEGKKVKVLAYTNKVIDNINDTIARRIKQDFGRDIIENMILTSKINQNSLVKTAEYIIIKVALLDKELELKLDNPLDFTLGVAPEVYGKFKAEVYVLTLQNTNREDTVGFVIVVYKDTQVYIDMMNCVYKLKISEDIKIKLIDKIHKYQVLYPKIAKIAGKMQTVENTVKLGYCSTIHSAQGAQYDNVFLDYKIKNDNEYNVLLYVGISRAIQRVELINLI